MKENNCPFCNYSFYKKEGSTNSLENEKYFHLSQHREFKNLINEILKQYPYIKAFVKVKCSSQFNKHRQTHQFIQVLYNHQISQYKYLLNQFDVFLKKYGRLLDKVEKNMCSNKTLSDFFSFYSELEVMYQLENTFNEVPNVLKSDNEQNVDFILPKNKLIIEVKTPLESKKRLFDYIQDWKQQRQLKQLSKECPLYKCLLVINTKYNYPDFGNLSGFSAFLKDRKIFWKGCVAYNSFNGNGDIYVTQPKDIKPLLETFLKNLLTSQQQEKIK